MRGHFATDTDFTYPILEIGEARWHLRLEQLRLEHLHLEHLSLSTLLPRRRIEYKLMMTGSCILRLRPLDALVTLG